MVRCSVPFCSQQATHRFPKDHNLRNSWLKAIIRRHEGRKGRRTHLHTFTSFVKIPSLRHDRKDPKSVSSGIIWHKPIVSRPGITLKSNQLRQETQTENRLRLCATTELVLSDDESVAFYTGLDNYAQFTLLLSTLLPMANEIKYKSKHVTNLTTEDQFLMLLIKLRRCTSDFNIGRMFGVNKTDVSHVIITWVSFITDHWSRLDSWPNQDTVASYMPETFKLNFPSNGLVGDIVIPISDGNFQNALFSFSQYELKKSLKLISGYSPDGLIYYCLEHKRSAGDCDDLPIPDVMTVNHRLAKCIPMQKLISSTKMFKILASALDPIYAPLAPRIFGVCVMICSFKVGIVTVDKADS